MIRILNQSVQPFETEHIEIVRKLACECTLFLKRDNEAFPVEPGEIALYGSGARKTIKGGTGSGDVNVRHYVNVEEGLEKAGFVITSKDWMDRYDQLLAESKVTFIAEVKKEAVELGINPVMYGMGKSMPEPEYQFPIDAKGDTAIYVLARNSGEGSDRSCVAGDIDLSDTEIRDILYCREKYKKFMLVLNVGGMVNLEPVKAVENILLLSQLGTPIGGVLADILTGKAYPSGKLSTTWAPIDLYPSTQGFGDMDDTYYNEGIYVGYRYFDTAKVPVSFPFGYGLSYTSFESRLVDVLANENEIQLKIEVTNTGKFVGKEVVQVYTSSPEGNVKKVCKELRAFAKTKELLPKESEVLSISFRTSDMCSYNSAKAAYVMEAGEYLVSWGNSSSETNVCAVITLDDTVCVKKCKNICNATDVKSMELPYVRPQFDERYVKRICIKAANFETKVVEYSVLPKTITSDVKCNFDDVRQDRASLDDFVSSLSNEQLAYLLVGLFDPNAGMGSMIGAASKSVAGAAGETTDRLKNLSVPTLVMSDGPAGIRVCTQYKEVNGAIKAMDNPLANMMQFMEPEQVEAMAKMAPKPSQEELDAPMYYMYCTAIPIGTALAQSFATQVCEKIGNLVGKEMEMFGVNLWLAPAMNIHRSPLCGRNFEYYSEDPLLSGLMAAAINNGVARHKSCGTTVKHFALNNQETNRTSSNSIADEQTIREIYLKNYEICLNHSKPATVMSSYNLVNGVHTNNSYDLLTSVLRDEWNYQGFVMTDWFAIGNLMSGNDARANKHSCATPSKGIYAGNDLIMPGMQIDYDGIISSIDNVESKCSISRGMLQASAKRILQVMLELGE